MRHLLQSGSSNRARYNERIRAILSVSDHRWVRTQQLCNQLGISRATLYRQRMAGLLLPGQHFRRSGTGSLGPLVWDVAAVDLTLRSICWG
jgi:predicted DNA-binding transcriptional regulator AlpA